ncbi:MAG: BrnT family toxin [Ruminococcus sp.]|nr:BrnT family toxin [Ruminococcus sp.]MCD7773598.1 BrnT family toxin [Ruminococcus sp.]
MQFEWDEQKEKTNIAKHKVDFTTAMQVFKDPNYIEIYDVEHSLVEDRYAAIGSVGTILFVVFTERVEKIRIISARLATKAERRLYYERNGIL